MTLEFTLLLNFVYKKVNRKGKIKMKNILDTINSPADVKALGKDELNTLADEIRETLIKRVTVTGGHMGSNLGFVEATIALHYVFDSPKDKFVFDVSHQSYTHKILTGRKEGFTNPDKYYSLSGYTTPSESEHDFFKVGHTSTSVSLAVGLAKGRELNGEKENIIAVIGDGSLSGGEAYEGLNNAAMLGSNIIIVVNDNEMSIAPNQGGLYKSLQQLRETNGTAENNFFKSLGLEYRYLEDGNDVEKLISLFNEVKDTDKPTVVHIHTLKGKGLKWAMEDKESGHWALPASLDLEAASKIPTYEQITADYLLEKMKNDKSVIAVSAATPAALGMDAAFREKAGKQFVDVGIAEEHAVAFVSGIAKNHGKPVFAVASSFVQRTYDQLNQDLAMNNNPATVLVFWGNIGGGDCTHNGMYDISMTGSIPNLVCLAPTVKEQYLAMLDWSINQTDRPVVIRVPDTVIESGKEEFFNETMINKMQVRRSGSSVAILGLGNAFSLAKDAAELLEKEHGIKATLIDPVNYTSPDKETLEELKKNHSVIVTVENGVLDGGFGQKIAASYSIDSSVKVLNFGAEKNFNDLVSADTITKQNHMTKEQIVEDIIKIL